MVHTVLLPPLSVTTLGGHQVKLRKTLAAAGALAIAGSAFAMQPSQAAEDSTTVTFSIDPGELTIVAPASKDLDGAGALELLSGVTNQVSGTLGSTTVSDTRGSLALGGWKIYASMDAGFTNGTTTIPVTNVTVDTGAVLGTNVVVTPVVGGAALTAAGADTEIASAAVTLGSHDATYDPTITITVPVDASAGDYSGVLVQSVY